jgi:caffeoyl-CoA O-methyltransferase
MLLSTRSLWTALVLAAVGVGLAALCSAGEEGTQAGKPSRAARLGDTVAVVVGDALETLPKLDGEFDFVFIDAQKADYMRYLRAIEPKLKPGALVVADNTILYADQMRDFLDHLERSGSYDAVTIRASMDKNVGMTIAWKIK